MKRLSLTFTARPTGSTGPFSRQTVAIEAATPETAPDRLYEQYERARVQLGHGNLTNPGNKSPATQ